MWPNIVYLCQKSLKTCSKFPGMPFSQNKKNPTSKFIQDLDAEQNVDTSRIWTRKPKSSNIHIYHFHILESPHLDFSKFWGWGEKHN